MYKTVTKSEFKTYFNLPEDYSVDGTVVSGSWKSDEYYELIKRAISESGRDAVFEILSGFLSSVLVFNIEGKRFWFDVFYGGARLSEFLHLACLFGAKKNIFLGSCGGLNENGLTGDIILPNYSVGNESTTRMYNPDTKDNKHYADEDLLRSLKNKIHPGYKIHEGAVITCQAMLAETLEDVLKWSKEGYLGVEMESSTVFAVSKYFNVPAAAILTIADNLIKGEMIHSEDYAKLHEYRDQVRDYTYKVALEELLTSA